MYIIDNTGTKIHTYYKTQNFSTYNLPKNSVWQTNTARLEPKIWQCHNN